MDFLALESWQALLLTKTKQKKNPTRGTCMERQRDKKREREKKQRQECGGVL